MRLLSQLPLFGALEHSWRAFHTFCPFWLITIREPLARFHSFPGVSESPKHRLHNKYHINIPQVSFSCTTLDKCESDSKKIIRTFVKPEISSANRVLLTTTSPGRPDAAGKVVKMLKMGVLRARWAFCVFESQGGKMGYLVWIWGGKVTTISLNQKICLWYLTCQQVDDLCPGSMLRCLTRVANLIVEITRSTDRLISTMGIRVLEKQHLCILNQGSALSDMPPLQTNYLHQQPTPWWRHQMETFSA